MKAPLNRLRRLLFNRWTLVGLALVAASAWAWQRWLAPTRIAVVNYRDFQFAEMLDAKRSPFIRVDRIDLAALATAPLSRYDAVYLFGRGLNLTAEQNAAVRRAALAGSLIYVHAATSADSDLTNLAGDELRRVSAYFDNGGRRNLQALFAYTRAVLDRKPLFAGPVAEPQVIPTDTFFHHGADNFFGSYEEFARFRVAQHLDRPGAPRVALVTTIAGPRSADRAYVDELIDAAEARGWNVYPISSFLKRLEFLQAVAPDLVIYLPHGRLAPGASDAAQSWLRERNIPLLCPVDVFEPHEQWLEDQKGMQGAMLTQGIVAPELDGGIAPQVVGAQFKNAAGLYVFKAAPGRIARLVESADRWLALRAKPNREKRLAIVYFKGPGLNALVASGLEVAPSLLRTLRHLQAEGYDTGPLPATDAEFAALLQQRGPVLGEYARGAFTDFLAHGDPELIPVSRYREWVRRDLDPIAYAEVEQRYGLPPGEHLVTEHGGEACLAIPRLRFGNIVLVPQLLPALGDDTSKLVHGARQAPPHPYLASYLWIREGFRADALLHFGTHGSLEFTPYKQVALSPRDWPDQLVGPLPHVYFYTINNIGEAIIAKRRSYAALVSHLTPPFAEGGVSGELAALAEKLDAYERAEGSVREAYSETIKQLVAHLKLDRDLALPADFATQPFDEALFARLHNYVETVAQEKIALGLYTAGEPYAPDRLTDTVRQMAVDPVASSLARLEVLDGKVDSRRIDDKAFFDERYRQPAFALVDRLLAGTATPESLLAAQDLVALTAYDREHRTLSDDELFAEMLGLGGSAPAPVAQKKFDQPRLEELVLAAASDAKKAEFLLSLKNEQTFAHTSRVLDPQSFAKAERIAKMIPAMRESLELMKAPGMLELVGLMQHAAARERVFALLADPAVQQKLQAERGRQQAADRAQAREPANLADLRLAVGEDALAKTLAGWDRRRLTGFSHRLRFYAAHPDFAVEALRSNGAAVELAPVTAQIAAAQAAAQRQLGVLADRERQRMDAVRTLRDSLAAVPAWRQALAKSPQREFDALSRALAGGFISPSSGGDPITNPQAVPTGRNLFSIDAEKTPTEEAWRIGRQLGEQLIARHRAETGNDPHKVALTLWPGEFISTQGADIAQVLWLLGVEPVRNSRGQVFDVRLIPAAELGRPRIDVVVQTAGQFRDLAASRLYLVHKAVGLASEAEPAPGQPNHVREGTRRAEEVMKERGLSPLDARTFATARIFGGVNGAYGTAIMGLVESGDRWGSDREIAEQYLRNMGAVYATAEAWGSYQPGIFEAALQHTDTVVQFRASNQTGPLSLDHVYEFMGGINLAVRHVTGRDPAAYFSDLRNLRQATTQNAREAVMVEARATLLNPKYITALQAGGASSAEKFAETFRNVYGWNVMKPAAIDPALWDALHATYVRDEQHLGLAEFFRRENPYALQEMTAVMLETVRKGYWKPSAEVQQEIVRLHTQLVAAHRAGCSGFVCDNAALREMIAQLAGGELAPAYRAAIEQARTGGAPGANVKGVTLEKETRTLGATPASPQPAAAAIDRPAVWIALAVLGAASLGYVLWRRRRSA